MLVSDNRTCYSNEEFKTLKRNGIQHVTSAPYHPPSKGVAERAVQTFKEGMKKIKGDTVETRVARFLLIIESFNKKKAMTKVANSDV